MADLVTVFTVTAHFKSSPAAVLVRADRPSGSERGLKLLWFGFDPFSPRRPPTAIKNRLGQIGHRKLPLRDLHLVQFIEAFALLRSLQEPGHLVHVMPVARSPRSSVGENDSLLEGLALYFYRVTQKAQTHKYLFLEVMFWCGRCIRNIWRPTNGQLVWAVQPCPKSVLRRLSATAEPTDI